MNYDKLIKLLRLAERATEPGERDLAMAKAQEMATRMQVDLATLDTTEQERKEDFDRLAVPKASRSFLNVVIMWLLEKHFRVEACHNRSSVFLVGRKSDLIFAQYLFGYLADHWSAAWKQELRKPSPLIHGRRSANSFFYGCYSGLKAKLDAVKKEAEKTRIAEISFSQASHAYGADVACSGVVSDIEETLVADNTRKYQLAVVAEEDALEQAYRAFYPNVRQSGSRVSTQGQSRSAGYAVGQRTSIPGVPLGNSSRSALS